MLILIDLDGTVFDWSGEFDREVVERFPHIEFPHLKNNVNWDMTTGLDEEGKAAIETVMALSGFYRNLKPLPGAVEAVHEMETLGHTVFFCTSPYDTNPTCADDKRASVAEHFGAQYRKKVIITSDKTLIRGDILIDDKPEMYGALAPVWDHVIFTQPYNEHINDSRIRIKDWSEYQKAITTWEASYVF